VKKVSVEKQYAIAVRDEACLFLFMWVKWVKRPESDEFFAFLPRPHDTSINAHASYHANGRYHIKTHNMPKIMYKQKRKPDRSFAGTENLLEQTITHAKVRSIGQKCDPNEFSEVFEIPVSELETRTYILVTADLVSLGHGPNLVPNARVIRQKEYRDVFPFIVFTLYEMPAL
jgi:hypothetical protein